MTDLINSAEQLAEKFEAPPDPDEAILGGVIDLVENYQLFRKNIRQMFSAYFMYGHPVHEGQRELLIEELGIQPHPTIAGMVVTKHMVELYVTIGCYDSEPNQSALPYDITYSTSENGLRPPSDPPSPAVEA